MNLKDIIAQKIYTAPLSAIPSENKCIINALNPHSYIIAKKDKVFEESLLSSDVLLPDGIGIVFAAKFLKIKGIKKIAGADMHQYLLAQANEKGKAVFYLGATEITLQRIEKKVQQEYPLIRVGSYGPPFSSVLSKEESNKIVKVINKFKPDILFVGMTAPKQELWVHQHKEFVNAQVIASIGAVFDFYAGSIKRPGPIWIKLGLEWFIRLLREPKRLWKRNFISTPLFLWEVLKEKWAN
jgi:N-acetylglucosaminyldiphosphoundecaprenol N-acetyl-beta-D-mannosaminyltransferase